MGQVKPRYEVEKLEGTRTHQIAKVGKNGGFEYEDKEVPAGYMVYFPSGSSIRLSEEDLITQGFDKPSTLVDMESGDEVGVAAGSLKAKHDQVVARGRRKGLPSEDQLPSGE